MSGQVVNVRYGSNGGTRRHSAHRRPTCRSLLRRLLAVMIMGHTCSCQQPVRVPPFPVRIPAAPRKPLSSQQDLGTSPSTPSTLAIITKEEAQEISIDYLTSLWDGALPDEVFTAGSCTSQCIALEHKTGISDLLVSTPAEPCDAWTCPFSYGTHTFGQHLEFEVAVQGGSAPSVRRLDIPACATKAHNCRLETKASNAIWLANPGSADAIAWLRWDEDLNEFYWDVEILVDPVRVQRISCHDQ
jgi:hypothetical protein